MTFCDNLLKSFSENLKQLTKMNDFLLFLRFYQNRRILHCFHHRYEFCMQKYPSNNTNNNNSLFQLLAIYKVNIEMPK